MSALISASDLAKALSSDQPPVVLDVRWSLTGPSKADTYADGHVPGARFVELDAALSAPPVGAGPRHPGGRHPLPDPQVFENAMGTAGVSRTSTVVVYGDPDGFGPARAWWCLRYFGHEAVRVLDGGYAAWTEAGLPIETGLSDVAPGDFEARAGGMAMLDAGEAAKVARAGVLLDARAGERYRGEVEPIDPAGGHIPGALNAPTAENLDAAGRFRSVDALRERFASLGLGGSGPVGVYCGSGVSAAQEVLALELAGIHAALYVGSWSDWVSDPDRPVATGATP
ncbi:sulfurtransferase [Actinopolymorpha alba]|uniref:sulfurtransferase n=1 Tax=Actinopolymorpha alba TaxID=533267 RepID=UPI000373634A|nr:sulfurtransferase [Actinopolymorpha alba]